MYREKGGIFPYGFLTPGSPSYDDALWDWDSYFSNVVLKQIIADVKADDCEPVINLGFQNWNMLVLNMIYWYEGKEYIEEF